MNFKLFNSFVFVFIAIVAWVSLISGCVAQSASTRVSGQQGSGAKHGSGAKQPLAAEQAEAVNPLMDPALATKQTPETPDKFRVKFITSKGNFVVEVTRAWAPKAADRFYVMCRNGYFKDIAIFRSIKDFMFQFGIHGDPAVSAKWMDANIEDDQFVGISNTRGTLSFAQTQRPNSRSVQMFVNLGNNDFLDKARGGSAAFVPFARIVQGINVIGKVHVTGENEPDVQGNFKQGGNKYIKTKYPHADYIRSVEVSIVN